MSLFKGKERRLKINSFNACGDLNPLRENVSAGLRGVQERLPFDKLSHRTLLSIFSLAISVRSLTSGTPHIEGPVRRRPYSLFTHKRITNMPLMLTFSMADEIEWDKAIDSQIKNKTIDIQTTASTFNSGF
jgi:hypothetical protein